MSQNGTNTSRQLRILYLDGPGDIAETYRQWKAGERDSGQLAKPYSGQFFEVCRALGAQGYVLSTSEKPAYIKDEAFTIEHRALNGGRQAGIRFHVGQIVFAARLIWTALRFRADIVLVAESVHWFLLAPLSWLGIPLAPMLHCTLWPKGYPPARWTQRTILRCNGWFWRRRAGATLAISAECARQIMETAGGQPRGPVLETRPSFYPETFAEIAPPPPRDGRPFRVLFAGRVEQPKGVFDLLEAAARLQQAVPGGYVWDVCGQGGALEQLQRDVQTRGLGPVVHLHGYLGRAEITAKLGQCHAVIVPTTAAFAEGMNKTVIEAVLAGRPVVATNLCPAVELLGHAIVEVPPGDIDRYVAAFRQLRENPAYYAGKTQRRPEVEAQFYDHELSWASGLKRVIELLAPRATEAILRPPVTDTPRHVPASVERTVLSPAIYHASPTPGRR